MQLRSLHEPSQLPREPQCRIYLLGDRNRYPVVEFLEQIGQSHPSELTKLLNLLDRSCEHGIPKNTEKVRNLGDGLFEFKTGGGVRVFWFWDEGRMVICAHGIVKKSRKTPKKDLKVARERQAAYQEAKKNKQIKILQR